MQKKNITADEALQMVYDDLQKADAGDIMWELAHEMMTDKICEIQEKYVVIGDDGEPYTDGDEVQWYDDDCEDYAYELFMKVRAFFDEEEIE
jgi:hypothetical protein